MILDYKVPFKLDLILFYNILLTKYIQTIVNPVDEQSSYSNDSHDAVVIKGNIQLQFKVKLKYDISYILTGSPAHSAVYP